MPGTVAVSSALTAVALAAAGVSPPRVLELPRLPRLEGRADLSVWRASSGERRIWGTAEPLYVRAADAAAAEQLRQAGLEVEPGAWRLVRPTSAALLELLGTAGVVQVRAAPPHQPLLDVSLPEIGADLVHRGEGVETARRGRGVLVGIVDTGVDLGHPAFEGPDGESRVVAVWDQDAVDGTPPPAFGYGHLCEQADVRAGRCDIGDATGHGSHVAGIAAGRDGVAPEADIAVVRSDTFTRIADAALFLADLAARRGQAVVINLSVGGHYGRHDGRTPLESYLAALAGPGVIIVAAAGNDGASRAHLGCDLHAGAQRVALEGVPWDGHGEVEVALWSTPQAEVEVAIELWLDGQPVVSVPLVAHGDDYLDGDLVWEGHSLLGLSYAVDWVTEHDAARRSVILEGRGAPAPVGAVVSLVLRGSGRIDAWVRGRDAAAPSPHFGLADAAGWISGDARSSVTVPATTGAVIAVGSYSVRSSWVDEDETLQGSDAVVLGSLSPFSSHGPTTRPSETGIKPDLLAPGSMIVSARAVQVPSGPRTLDAEHFIAQGTSMAAPHVAGTIALMLEASPGLDPPQVRALLGESARHDPEDGELPNDERGWGRLDAAAAVAAAETRGGGCRAVGSAAAPVLVALLMGRRRRRAA